MTDRKELTERWDVHTTRQLDAAKGGAIAVTLLNSGSWLALLSQVGSLSNIGIGWPIALWGAGAFFGTCVWLFIYRGTALQWLNDLDPNDDRIATKIDRNGVMGYSAAVAAVTCFAGGAGALSYALW